jgi:hypothetical protein
MHPNPYPALIEVATKGRKFDSYSLLYRILEYLCLTFRTYRVFDMREAH